MSFLKTNLFLSTAIILHAGYANANTLSYGNSYSSSYDSSYGSYTYSEPKTNVGFGAIAVGALALGAIAVVAGSGGGNNDDSSSDEDDSADQDTDAGSDEDDISEETDETTGEDDTESLDPSFFETPEYERSWGLSSINASSRYADGGTGEGVIGAIFDTGVDLTNSEFSDKVIYTYSYYDGTSDVTDTDGHGTSVLGVIGANKDDTGIHGVAYDSTFVVFQGVGDDLIMNSVEALADATIQAADLGVTAINHSWVFVNSDDTTLTIDQFSSASEFLATFGTDLFDALDYAVENDMISVFAAGNSGKSEVSAIGGLPVYFPEYEDYFLVVVSIDENDEISDFSEQCGMAANFCLAAPGEDIVTTYLDDTYVTASGTSYSAPYVTGAVLVLASNFPELTASEITTILLETARDLGEEGVDEVYGWGALDLENALAPQGTLTVQTSSTLNEESYTIDQSHISTSGGMAAALIASFADQDILITDGYDRGYLAGLDAFVGSGMDAEQEQTDQMAYALGFSPLMAIASGNTRLSFAPGNLGAVGGNTMSYHYVSPYAGLVDNPSSISAEFLFNGGSFKLSQVFSDEDSISSSEYYSAEVQADIGKHAIVFGVGSLSEDGAFVGTDVTGAFGNDLESDTQLLSLRGEFDIGYDRSITLGGALGVTDFSGDGVLQAGKDIKTSSYGIGYTQNNAFTSGDSFTVSASRSLNIHDGEMTLNLPTSLGASTDGVRSQNVEMSVTDIDLVETTAPVDFRLSYEMDAFGGRLAFAAAMREGDSHHRVASFGYTVHF